GAAGTAGAAGAGGLTLTSAPVLAGAGITAAAGAAAVAFVVVTNSIFGHNLVVNGDAEAGSGATDDQHVVAVPGWRTTGEFTAVRYGAMSGVFPDASTPGPSSRGQNFFAGGRVARSTAMQTIDVSSGGGGIDSWGKRYVLSGWLGGFGSQGDSATVSASFEDASGRQLGVASIGPVTSLSRHSTTELVKAETSGVVPDGTRRIVVQITLIRTDGIYNDGYVDDLTLTIN
ncbi:MAG TPA: hypothetical protein VG245_01990, partial [Candidatus Dormibacteraeota bacterium]|nr:hypothetical protein [Candidatus Dormibacteraeota bacterium]